MVINEWRINVLCVNNKENEIECMILSIFCELGNVMVFIPIIWKNMLCFKYKQKEKKENDILLNVNKQNERNNNIESLCKHEI